MHAKLYFLVFVLGVAFAGESRAEGLLQTILDRGYVNIGYRTAAPPFSYRNEIGEPAGYTVDLCRGHCQIKILSICKSPNSCRKSQGFCALHGRPRITFST